MEVLGRARERESESGKFKNAFDIPFFKFKDFL